MSIVQYRVSPTVADDADEPSWLTVLSSDDTTKDGVTTSWVVTSILECIKIFIFLCFIKIYDILIMNLLIKSIQISIFTIYMSVSIKNKAGRSSIP